MKNKKKTKKKKKEKEEEEVLCSHRPVSIQTRHTHHRKKKADGFKLVGTVLCRPNYEH